MADGTRTQTSRRSGPGWAYVPGRIPQELRDRLQAEADRRFLGVALLVETALEDALRYWEAQEVSPPLRSPRNGGLARQGKQSLDSSG